MHSLLTAETGFPSGSSVDVKKIIFNNTAKVPMLENEKYSYLKN